MISNTEALTDDDDYHQVGQVAAPTSILAVEDLPILGDGWPESRMITWKDIAAYRQRFQAKISSNVVISTQARMGRVTDNVLIQLCNRLVCRESHLASLQEAQDHFESLPHDEFFTLVLDLYRDADRILSPESHIETKIKSLPLKLSLTDLSAGFQYQTSVHSLLKREGRDPWTYFDRQNSKVLETSVF